MIDYDLKASVLKTDLPQRVCRLMRKYRKIYNNVQVGFDEKLIEADNTYCDLVLTYGLEKYKEAIRINNAWFKRVTRLYNRVSYYLQFPCVFITLTFRDEVLNATNETTRRKYVSRFLKTLTNHFVANIDFGVDDRYTHREHYHALLVGCIKKRDLSWWTYNIGFTYIETVRGTNDFKAISKYISKLTNHAIKQSTRRHVYIYSRDN